MAESHALEIATRTKSDFEVKFIPMKLRSDQQILGFALCSISMS
jgi:hypothetical protein